MLKRQIFPKNHTNRIQAVRNKHQYSSSLTKATITAATSSYHGRQREGIRTREACSSPIQIGSNTSSSQHRGTAELPRESVQSSLESSTSSMAVVPYSGGAGSCRFLLFLTLLSLLRGLLVDPQRRRRRPSRSKPRFPRNSWSWRGDSS
jgi:hypothetical protein